MELQVPLLLSLVYLSFLPTPRSKGEVTTCLWLEPFRSRWRITGLGNAGTHICEYLGRSETAETS